MTAEEIKNTWESPAYEKARNSVSEYRFAFLTIGGSVAYGTNTPNSDLDLRGCMFNSAEDILTGRTFDQFCFPDTDTTIYSFDKLMKLWTSANPNAIELLGNADSYAFYDPAISAVFNNAAMFLSRTTVVHSFYGYAYAQLRRLNNFLARTADDDKRAAHVLKSLEMMQKDGFSQYLSDNNDLYITVNVENMPWSKFSESIEGYKSTIKSYQSAGKRNLHALEHKKLSKHMMHLIRLYMMAIDILESGKIRTKRVDEHDLLMSIRNGDYLVNDVPTAEFEDLLKTYEKRLDYAKENTSLPDEPDYKFIKEVHALVNYTVLSEHLNWVSDRR
jgi:hypothetical protein